MLLACFLYWSSMKINFKQSEENQESIYVPFIFFFRSISSRSCVRIGIFGHPSANDFANLQPIIAYQKLINN